ncbi:MAG TPA: transcription termination factor NusA [Candidatus Paceibacterota bacterium]|nr:transcription termination factor NusA [Candidatus Paceibacterota bacterium]
MLDIKTMKLAIEQLEEEKGLPKGKLIDAIEASLAAAYKKDFGKKGQIVRAVLDEDSGAVEYSQVKIVVDDTMVRQVEEGEELGDEISLPVIPSAGAIVVPQGEEDENGEPIDLRVRFNPEHHIMIEDARLFKRGAALGEEIIFPLEMKDDFGRIAAQTAKQVIIQKIREAERGAILEEFSSRGDEVITGTIQRIERGNIFVDLGRATAILAHDDQIPGERVRIGDRIRAYLYSVEETPRGVSLRLSRAHPSFVKALFALEAPEIANGVVEIKSIAREPGSRTKIAVTTTDEHIDPIGTCVGQRGTRVSTIINELGGEKIDIIQWSPNAEDFIAESLSPARVGEVVIDEDAKHARVQVAADQLSLAIGKSGQNVRLAARLTGYRIDINSREAEAVLAEESAPMHAETAVNPEEEVAEFIASDDNAQAVDPEVSAVEERVDDRSVAEENVNDEA